MSDHLRIWHPFSQEALDPPPIHIAKAEGVYLYTRDGRRLIDGISSWWVNIHGHCHPAIMSAIAEQTAKIDHVLLAGFTHEGVEELCACLQKVLPPALDHLFFSDNGSTAVEVALKMAVQYWENVDRPEKKGIVALEHAYHGDTAGAMSVSDDSRFTEPFRSMLFPVHRVHSAYCYRCPVGKVRATCQIECVDQLARLLEEKHDTIAAVIVEPLLQGAGGMIVHPVEFLQRVRALCTKYDVLLIADEVLTGFGRSGKMFACELAGSGSRSDVPFQRNHGRSASDGGNGVHWCDSRCFRQHRPFAHFLSRPFLHGKPTRGSGSGCEFSHFRTRTRVRANQRDCENSRAAACEDQESSRRRGGSIDRRGRGSWNCARTIPATLRSSKPILYDFFLKAGNSAAPARQYYLRVAALRDFTGRPELHLR